MEFHILNGDALYKRFPDTLSGGKIIVRECLVDGPVGSNLDELYPIRARFLGKVYPESSKDYYEHVVPHLEKVKQIKHEDVVNLWFEDDLFCQVHLWFVAHVLVVCTEVERAFLVRALDLRFGFGGMSQSDLLQAYASRQSLNRDQLLGLSRLWIAYQRGELKQMITIAQQFEHTLSFLQPAVKAHIDRNPLNQSMGKPQLLLQQIREELNTDDFPTVFKEFTYRGSIYGFGDVQVKRIWDEMVRN